MTALRALLSGIVDYAGLYPPAALDMRTAVRHCASYSTDPASWMLGRFVVPVGRLDELSAEWQLVSEGPRVPVRFSVVLGDNVTSDIAQVEAFESGHTGDFILDAVEARLSTEAAIERAALAVRSDCELFAELPIDADPAPLVATLSSVGASAKVRTGGVTPDAFPTAVNVVRFMRRCLDSNVRFKATAGLHHPVRADYPLSYSSASPCGTMFGYLNLFLAAGLMMNGLSDADTVRVLDERDPSSFSIEADGISWNDYSLNVQQLSRLRQWAVSFGSCSFREPVDELRTLSLLD
jgi:hypothetical protein